MNKANPYLYLLVRNDMDSMNAGKAVAHGAHAANQFTHEMMETVGSDDLTPVQAQFDQWTSSANGFGVTITLAVSLRELQTAVMVAKSLPDLFAGETIDPTYPYILNREYARLIDHKAQVSPETLKELAEEGNPNNDPTPIGKGNMLCLRNETTAGYVFGDKAVAKMVVGNFPLMP